MKYLVTIPVYFNYAIEADTKMEAEIIGENTFAREGIRSKDFPSARIETGDTISIPYELMYGKEKKNPKGK